MNCDLHTHSIYSDGTFTPAEIIAEAKRLGLDAVALTDHNTIAGLPEFMEEARRQGVTAVGGVELSTDFEGKEFHLLGLFIAPEYYKDVENLAKEYHVLKEISNIETVERLNDAGYDIHYSEIRKQNPTGNINRAHMAAELMKKGYVKSINEAFNTMLSDTAGFYIPLPRLSLTEAVGFLRRINAVPVIAHPLNDTDEKSLREMLPELIDAGLMGIEVMHSMYSEATQNTAVRIAEDFSLLLSGGSDFHGKTKPDILLATGRGTLSIPEEIYYKLYEARLQIKNL